MNVDYLIIALNIAVLGFVWSLHRDVADLRECMARLEGLFEGFTKRDTIASRNERPAT